MDFLNWYISFTSRSLYGFLPILAVVYAVFFVLRKAFKKLPDPGVFVALAFFIGIATIPSIPRYTFEKEVLSYYKNLDEFKLVDSAKWGALVEPLTLIKTPTGFFHFVGPLDFYPFVFGLNNQRQFLSMIHRYEEPTVSQVVHADCSDMTYWLAEPGQSIVKEQSSYEKMNNNQKISFCETDYARQVKISNCKLKILSELSEVTEEANINANTQCKIQ
jgi:energy-coupling factor transporter transmembrane protein EcfT